MNRSAVVCVSQLNRYVKAMLDSDSALDGLMVRGEISNFLCHYKSGHMRRLKRLCSADMHPSFASGRKMGCL